MFFRLAEEYVHFLFFAVSYKVSLTFFGLEVNGNFLCVLAECELYVLMTSSIET